MTLNDLNDGYFGLKWVLYFTEVLVNSFLLNEFLILVKECTKHWKCLVFFIQLKKLILAFQNRVFPNERADRF